MKKIFSAMILSVVSLNVSAADKIIKLSSPLKDSNNDGKIKVTSMAKKLGVKSGTVLTVCSEQKPLYVYSTGACPASKTARQWILNEFATAPLKTGTFSSRQFTEVPTLVKDASATKAKYGFDLRDAKAPSDRRAAFVDVSIKDLKSSDAFGAGIITYDNGIELFISNVSIEPNWPQWVSYSKTNYDGMVLDGAKAIYADTLTIKNWNADSAIDNKAAISQFVNIKLEGSGHRGLRYWTPGPHYLVDSNLNNARGSILWFRNCATATLYIYNSTFNGASEAPKNKIECETGKNPKIVYLNYDPKTSGEMHEMFSP